MPGCNPVILMLQVDNPNDEAKLKQILTDVAPLIMSPITGLQATPDEVKQIANGIMNVIISFQIVKAHEEFAKENPDEAIVETIAPMPDDNPFEGMAFYDYDDGSWSSKA
jgi:hypothetical protein